MTRRRSAGWAIAAGCLLVAVSVVLLFWPMKGNGLTGTAARPRYGAFGWFASAPLSADPSLQDLRDAGAVLPQDVVAGRRRQVVDLAAVGFLAIGVGGYWQRRDVTGRRPSAAR